MNRFAGTQPRGFVRKAFWITVATIIAMLAWAAAGLSQGGPYFEYDPDGMMRPDGTIQQYPGGHRPMLTYTAKPQHNGSYLVLRNGVAWITLSTQKNQFVISDPNGTGQAVVKLDQTSRHGGGAPVKLRAPAP